MKSMEALRNMPNIRDDLREAETRREFDREREQIKQLVLSIRHHIRAIRLHAASLQGNPESSREITLALVGSLALFWVGVIYPLSFLPVRTGEPIHIAWSAVPGAVLSLRGGMLALPAFVFTIMLLVLEAMNLKLKYSPQDVQKLEERTELSSYSPHLGVLEENDPSWK
jgi:hypothetical protein